VAKVDGSSKALPRPSRGKKAAAPAGAFVITVDGTEYVLDPGAVSALDEDRIRAVTKSRLTLTAVMQSLFAGQGGLSDVAAVAFLGECQAGRNPSWEKIAGSIKATSEITYDVVGEDTSDPE
jgi:ABC-type amino acid transport substrate-binding protein